jgi:signal transduction histidine kinase
VVQGFQVRQQHFAVRWERQSSALKAQNDALQAACQELQHQNQMQQDLLSMIVHDLKTPLSIILGSLDLLADDLGAGLSEEQNDLVEGAVRSGQQMLDLVANLLEMQHLEAGQMPINIQPLDTALILTATLAHLQPLAQRKGVVLGSRFPRTLPWVFADADLLARTVANLLDNAIKFTPLGGQIVVDGQVKEHQVIIAVTDEGPGIPSGEQNHIFEKFAQIGQGARRGSASVGLGLAFCKLAVEAQRGRIWVENDVRAGAQFKFSLPMWRGSNAPVEED